MGKNSDELEFDTPIIKAFSFFTSVFIKEFLLGRGREGGGPNIFDENRKNFRRQGLPEARRKGVN